MSNAATPPLGSLAHPTHHTPTHGGPPAKGTFGGGGGWHKASVSGCLPLAVPSGLSPLLILTLCGSECVLVVSTEPLDDLSFLTTPVHKGNTTRSGKPMLQTMAGRGCLQSAGYQKRQLNPFPKRRGPRIPLPK